MGWELKHKFPENQVPTWENFAETPQVVQQKQTDYSPVWHINQGNWSLHHPRQSVHSFYKQVPHRHREMICQHQEGAPSHHVWLWEVPHLPIQKNIYSWNWPQTAGDDKCKKSHCSPSQAIDNPSLTAAVWHDHHVQTRQGNALSHLPSRTDTQIQLNLRVDEISMSAFTRSRLTKIAAEIQWDPILSTGHRLTLNGWPDRCTNIPRIARNYWDFHDELSIEDDLLMKGEWVVIPPSCRDSIMDDLHKSHVGINKALALARTCVYCPRMEADVTDYIKRCLTCIECSNLPVETLHPYQVPLDLGSR